MNHSLGLIQTLLPLSLPYPRFSQRASIRPFSIGYMFSKMERSPDDITSDELSVYFSVYRVCRQVCVIVACDGVYVCKHVGKMEMTIAVPEYLFQVAVVVRPPVGVCLCICM